jgi:hypothetical protein
MCCASIRPSDERSIAGRYFWCDAQRFILDTLEADLERMERINQTLAMMPEEARRNHPQKLRPIPVLSIRPSQDLGTLRLNNFIFSSLAALSAEGAWSFRSTGLGSSQLLGF